MTHPVRGDAGQEPGVSVGSQFSNAIISIQGLPIRPKFVSRSGHSTSWSGTLTASQDYAITV
jgi:hypothetical protein